MAIIIQNIGAKGTKEDLDPAGERIYQVRINEKVIATFTHRRGDGLATCLRKAADIVDERQLLDTLDYFHKTKVID